MKIDIPVTPRGGGTNVSGGSIPIKGGIVLVHHADGPDYRDK